jgi:alpha-glucoside transport system permease protein
MLSGIRTPGLRRDSATKAVAIPSHPAGAAAESEPRVALRRRGPGGGGWRSHLGSLVFLLPAAIMLGFIVVYPLVATVVRSLFDNSGTQFVGLGNYKEIFATNDILIALRNNVIWIIVFPFIVTFLGLVFAVLTEHIRWSTAFKTVVFMPIVFSLTASALIWRAVFDLDPHIGMVNAAVQTVSDVFNPPGLYPVDTSAGQSVATLASTNVAAAGSGTLLSTSQVSLGGVAKLGLIGISPFALQLVHAQHVVLPSAAQGAVVGVVWRDFSPTHPGSKGTVLPDEDGIPGLHLTLLRSDGASAATATTTADGAFAFDNPGQGPFRVQIDARNFQAGFTGISFLGTQSLTPTASLSKTAQALLSIPLVDIAMIIAMLWIWSGFAMVAIGAGLASLNREVLEAARIDGASEWQTFRRVTIPMLLPVLVVVFVTMLINVLKIFDIILNMPPGTSQQDASTLALLMYNLGFTSNPATGLASAVAVILFVLVVPAMLFNLRRIKG